MKRARPRPRRPLRNELLSLLPILALPLLTGLLFPYEAIGFHQAAPCRRTAPSCRIVELGEGVEERALDLVRASFSVRPETFQAMREDLLLAPLPEEETAPVLSPADRLPPAPSSAVVYDVLPFPPTLAAADLEQAPEDGPARPVPPTFPREELLKLD